MVDSNDKKPRKLTPQGFMKKAATTSGAIGFLAQYREYMTTGELASLLSPIVAKIDAKELLPTPGVREIANAVMTHIMAQATAKVEAAADSNARTGSSKPWCATVYMPDGTIATRINAQGEEEDLIKAFDKNADAMRWADRRLTEASDACYCEIDHPASGGIEVIHRQDALARAFRTKKGPTCQVKGLSTKTLGFTPHCKQSRASFSRG